MPPTARDPGAVPRRIGGVLFDKDGTLFGFQATWGGWACELVEGLAPELPARRAALAEALRLDLETRRFLADSPVIAGTFDDVIALLSPHLPDWPTARLRAHLLDRSRAVRPVEAVPLAPLLTQLRAAGLALGVATNDSEVPTHAQLDAIGAAQAFDFVAGSDSGHGAKPGPGMCLAFAEATGLSPDAVVMVGDSTHDLRAGGAAGMVRVAVLTGVATEPDLSPEADAVLPHIGHLPEWLGL